MTSEPRRQYCMIQQSWGIKSARKYKNLVDSEFYIRTQPRIYSTSKDYEYYDEYEKVLARRMKEYLQQRKYNNYGNKRPDWQQDKKE